VALLAAALRPETVRSLVVVEPPLLGAAPHDPAAAELADRLRDLDARASSMGTVEYFAAWSQAVLHRDAAASEAASASWSARDRAAVEATRRERSPVDAPVDFPALAALDVPKVVAVGGWPNGDMAARTAGRAFRAVARSMADRIGAEVVVFERSTHNPQLQQPDEFNALLRRVWSAVDG
jgi:pimeloyl-ACP methyl ester carboxylesterase